MKGIPFSLAIACIRLLYKIINSLIIKQLLVLYKSPPILFSLAVMYFLFLTEFFLKMSENSYNICTLLPNESVFLALIIFSASLYVKFTLTLISSFAKK